MFDITILSKEWMPAIIAGLFALFVTIVTIRSTHKSEDRGRDWERERVGRAETEKFRELEAAHDLNQAHDLTARFRTLMEGYENRIRDLTAELALRKAEHDRLEKLYEDRQILCNVCPTYTEHMRTRNARTSS